MKKETYTLLDSFERYGPSEPWSISMNDWSQLRNLINGPFIGGYPTSNRIQGICEAQGNYTPMVSP